MLVITVRNSRQSSQFDHPAGPLTMGREPDTSGAHFIVDDDYVSRRQLIVEQISPTQTKISNIGRNPLEFTDGVQLHLGEDLKVALPVQMRVGQTQIELAAGAPPPLASRETTDAKSGLFQTISLPASRQTAPIGNRSLSSLGETPSSETLAVWFETLLTVQRSAVGSTAFYEETARAVVELVGLDRGLVLLREGTQWKVIAGHARSSETSLTFSRSVVERVVEQERTFFGQPESLSVRASLANVESVVASPIFGAQTKVVGVLFGSRDCAPLQAKSGIHPLEAQIVQLLASSVSAGLVRTEMQERLKQMEQLAAVGQAISYIVHDLRGPLGNVQQLLDMIRTDASPAISRQEQIAMMDESLTIAAQLLNDSLEFCRGNVRVEMVRGSFATLFERHLRLLRMDLEKLGVALQLEAPAELQLKVDPDRMARVLRNLSKNAGEALSGRVGALVTIGARNTSTGCEIFVADNGPGLPAEVREKLFQPFSSHGKRGGTGFGLAIAKQLVEAHGGKISVSSDARGTRFAILLPADPTAVAPVTTASEPESDTLPFLAVPHKASAPTRPAAVSPSLPPVPPALPGSPGAPAPLTTAASTKSRFLLADDSLVNQRLIAGVLRSAGHEVSVVGSGQEALDAWKSQEFDVLLMDVEMPEMDGLAATRILRDLERPIRRHIPIIALTAHSSAEIRDTCTEAGMDAVLSKPLRIADLNDTLRKLNVVVANRG